MSTRAESYGRGFEIGLELWNKWEAAHHHSVSTVVPTEDVDRYFLSGIKEPFADGEPIKIIRQRQGDETRLIIDFAD